VNFGGLFKLAKSYGLRASDNNVRRTKIPPKARVRCLQSWDYVFIRANGDVQPCCAVFGEDKAAIMGNVFVGEFAGIWNGERFNEFRITSVGGTNSQCRICPMY